MPRLTVAINLNIGFFQESRTAEVLWLRRCQHGRCLEYRGEILERRIQDDGHVIVDMLLVCERSKERRVPGLEKSIQIGLVAADVGRGGSVEPSAGAGVQDHDLLFDGQRFVLALLEQFDQPLTSIELDLRRFVEIAAELCERCQLCIGPNPA